MACRLTPASIRLSWFQWPVLHTPASILISPSGVPVPQTPAGNLKSRSGVRMLRTRASRRLSRSGLPVQHRPVNIQISRSGGLLLHTCGGGGSIACSSPDPSSWQCTRVSRPLSLKAASRRQCHIKRSGYRVRWNGRSHHSGTPSVAASHPAMTRTILGTTATTATDLRTQDALHTVSRGITSLPASAAPVMARSLPSGMLGGSNLCHWPGIICRRFLLGPFTPLSLFGIICHRFLLAAFTPLPLFRHYMPPFPSYPAPCRFSFCPPQIPPSPKGAPSSHQTSPHAYFGSRFFGLAPHRREVELLAALSHAKRTFASAGLHASLR